MNELRNDSRSSCDDYCYSAFDNCNCTTSTTGENWLWNFTNCAVGLTIIIWASVKLNDGSDDKAEHVNTWPNVPDNYRTPPIKGYGTGRVYTDFYNIYYVLIFTGVAHTLLATLMFLSSTCKALGRLGPNSEGPRRIFNMMETAGYHGITDSLILVVLLKALAVLEPYAVYSLMACHFAAFYIVGLLQTETSTVSVDTESGVKSVVKSVFLNLPAVMILVPVWIVLFVYYCYFLDTDADANVGEAGVSNLVKHNAVLFFVMDVLGLFSISSTTMDTVMPFRLMLSRLTSTFLRVWILLTLLSHDHRLSAYNVLEQSSFP